MGVRTWLYKTTGIGLRRNLNTTLTELDNTPAKDAICSQAIFDDIDKNEEAIEQSADKNNEENTEIIENNEENTEIIENNQLNLDKYVNFGAIVHDSAIIGQYTYLNENAQVNSYTTIGKYCSIASDAIIAPYAHPINWLSTHPFQCDPLWAEAAKINGIPFNTPNKYTLVKNDVWIGTRAIIKRGVTIGNGAIIGSCAMVTKDVPDYAIVAGNPAKVIRYRFSQDIIDKLLKLEWWNLPMEKLGNVTFNDINEAITQLSEIINTER